MDQKACHPGYHTALKEVHALMLKKDEEPPHVEHVAELALQLFDQLSVVHKYNSEERWMLHAAALLHDIGWADATEGRKHHKIAANIIRKHSWENVPKHWIPITACLIRYHRRSPPRSHHRQFNSLSEKDRERVLKLAALLRLADGLDRPHLQRVTQIAVQIESEKIKLDIKGSKDLRVEIEGALRKSKLFKYAYRKEISIAQAD
jgi:exopolyphosphatase/guanosine-5'-triphosphate,3'-diphosphate pyrophosphatase